MTRRQIAQARRHRERERDDLLSYRCPFTPDMRTVWDEPMPWMDRADNTSQWTER